MKQRAVVILPLYFVFIKDILRKLVLKLAIKKDVPLVPWFQVSEDWLKNIHEVDNTECDLPVPNEDIVVEAIDSFTGWAIGAQICDTH